MQQVRRKAKSPSSLRVLALFTVILTACGDETPVTEAAEAHDISGRVTDSDGQGIRGFLLELSGPSVLELILTDETGDFSFKRLPEDIPRTRRNRNRNRGKHM